MKGFDEVIIKLCNIRRCFLVAHKGNIIEIQSDSAHFYGDLAYFKAVCDCFMAVAYGSTAWVVSVNIEEYRIELGYNYHY